MGFNYSLKEALWLHKFEVIFNLVIIVICVYYINANKETPELLTKFLVPFLGILILELFANLHYVFSLTRSNKTHLFVALFPLQLLRHAVRIGWFGYLIALAVLVTDIHISEPYWVFAIFIFSYIIVDSSMVFLLLTLIQSILLSIYMKKKYCKPQTWEPKPLEAKLPESKMLKDTVSLIAAMEEEKKQAAGAA